MCYNSDTLVPLAKALEPHLAIYSRRRANQMVLEHIQPLRGQRSEVVNLTEKFSDNRKKLGLNSLLNTITGSDNQLSALREAIMMVLRERAGLPQGVPMLPLKPALA